MSQPRRAAEFLKDVLKQVGQQRSRDVFVAALDELLPATQRSHCQVMGYRDGKLTLEVDSAPLFAELSGFQREQLRLAINERVGNRKVAQLQFRLGGTGHV